MKKYEYMILCWLLKVNGFYLKQLAFSLLNPFFDRAIFFVYQLSTYVMNCIDDCIYNILSFFFFVETHIAQASHCFYFGGMSWKLQEGVVVNLWSVKRELWNVERGWKFLILSNNLQHCIQYVYATFRIFLMKCECFKVGICTM